MDFRCHNELTLFHFRPPPPSWPPRGLHRQPFQCPTHPQDPLPSLPEGWKLQRHVSSQEFNPKSFRNFVEHVVDAELNHRLIPILAAAAANKTVLDLQDILQRLAFDNISEIAFRYDPACLLPSQPQSKLAEAFESSVRIICGRFSATHPLIWKIKRVLNVGSEKELRIAVNDVREFAKRIIKEKKQELNSKSSLESADLLSRFLNSGHLDENFITDILISFILAGRDTTSAALIWFFWLVSKNQM
ncbi:Cytochrome P450 94A1 [Camellia lanceoleosa]|uniref:Cytochrome P450 94A1 n=1 Tax=Camellia lanceoleosa TaxID=1840588 RepID=A0ACC0F6I2_9ERIC|nr:Cytochrome P450 94A1 [Camellia lanceoleosa]